MTFKDLTSPRYKMFCDPSVDIPSTVSGSAVAVQRGTCNFSDKARLAQHHGIHAVIVVSQKLVSEVFVCAFVFEVVEMTIVDKDWLIAVMLQRYIMSLLLKALNLFFLEAYS